jgi:hypothetical protein
MQYFEVPKDFVGDATCSDNDCPCGSPGAKIPPGSGYIYVSQDVVEFRRDALTAQEAKQKIALMRQKLNGHILFEQNVITATLMCEQGARKRGLDLAVAAADAQYWWKTGLVPLRATSLAGKPTYVPRTDPVSAERLSSDFESQPKSSSANGCAEKAKVRLDSNYTFLFVWCVLLFPINFVIGHFEAFSVPRSPLFEWLYRISGIVNFVTVYYGSTLIGRKLSVTIFLSLMASLPLLWIIPLGELIRNLNKGGQAWQNARSAIANRRDVKVLLSIESFLFKGEAVVTDGIAASDRMDIGGKKETAIEAVNSKEMIARSTMEMRFNDLISQLEVADKRKDWIMLLNLLDEADANFAEILETSVEKRLFFTAARGRAYVNIGEYDQALQLFRAILDYNVSQEIPIATSQYMWWWLWAKYRDKAKAHEKYVQLKNDKEATQILRDHKCNDT